MLTNPGWLGSEPSKNKPVTSNIRGESKAHGWRGFFLADLPENMVSLDSEPGKLGEHKVLWLRA